MPLSNAPLCTSECRRLRYSKVLLVYILSKNRFWQGIALYCIVAIVMEYQPVLLCCKMPCWVVEYWTVHMLARGVGILASTGNVHYSRLSYCTEHCTFLLQLSLDCGVMKLKYPSESDEVKVPDFSARSFDPGLSLQEFVWEHNGASSCLNWQRSSNLQYPWFQGIQKPFVRRWARHGIEILDLLLWASSVCISSFAFLMVM